ncbi:MAG: hypothetical protein ACYDCN_17210, partial [Bacteroidia bacterium]
NTAGGSNSDSKVGVAKTKFAKTAMTEYGKASNELFTQFVARIAQEMPTATLAMFSKMKYVNAPNFEKFREVWSAKFLNGFVVHSKSFDGLKGDFPIGFLIWKTNQKSKTPISEISVEVLDKNANPIGEKGFYNVPNSSFLNVWIDRPKTNGVSAIPLKNAVTPSTGLAPTRTTTDEGLGYLIYKGNDIQNSKATCILSSVYGDGHGIYITKSNVLFVAVMFMTRKIVKPTWLNDRDQFLQPTKPLSNEFKSDCLLWMLFNGSNLTAGANDLEWNNKKWSIVNHFIPYTEAEVNAPNRFESDFMVQYMADKTFSKEAKLVLEKGKELWQAYFAHTDERTVRDELKLNRPDVGWYQVRKALQARNAGSDFAPVSFKPFEEAYKALTEKLQPMVYELGFLKV